MFIKYALALSMFVSITNAKTIKITKGLDLKISIPKGYKISKVENTVPNLPETIIISNGDYQVVFNSIPMTKTNLKNVGGLEKLLGMMTKKLKSGAVEKKFPVKKLKITPSAYVTITDAKMVGKKSAHNNWRCATAGVIHGKKMVLNFTLFSHSFKGKEYKKLMKMLNGLKIK
ncbi:MAG: hypothetical protein HRT89_12555 [Lentisphaeria bacterium]|nr:hypothetical protein [Lentisphaeria bacterium]NQZ68888.1 hypothetical protein [Lentisphaeria bacterium]